MNLQAMTREKLQFLLPVVFTVGPDVNQRGASAGQVSSTADNFAVEDRGDALMKYSMLLADEAKANSSKPKDAAHLENIIKGIIEGETRVLVSSMTMEEIFTEREEFKRRIYHNIQEELNQFGLKIYNANVKELRDAPQSNYFESLSRKAHEGASNQARVDVAEAQLLGNVGEAQRVGQQNREIAKINAETAVQKTERDSEKARAEATLATRKTAYNRDVTIAQIEATRQTEVRDEELKKMVENKRAETEMERLRALDVVKATILREAKEQAANAKNYSEKADADAALYRQQKEADAKAYTLSIEADAAYHARTKEAEAAYVAKAKEAEGLEKMAAAYSKLSTALGGPQGLIQYMMIEKNIYGELGRANADAVRGMQPKITIWNTGNEAGTEGEGDGLGAAAAIRNTYRMLPPLMSTINEQTGITLPEWAFGKLATTVQEKEM
jgi:flotillin